MTAQLVDEHGRIIGTRITVYNLLLDFLVPDRTEAEICGLYDLTPHQVASGRAYIFDNIDRVLTRHLELEARNAAGNPPEVREEAFKSKESFRRYRLWVDERRQPTANQSSSDSFPTFRQWIAENMASSEGS